MRKKFFGLSALTCLVVISGGLLYQRHARAVSPAVLAPAKIAAIDTGQFYCFLSVYDDLVGIYNNGNITGFCEIYIFYYCNGTTGDPCDPTDVWMHGSTYYNLSDGNGWRWFANVDDDAPALECSDYAVHDKYCAWDRTSTSGTRWKFVWAIRYGTSSTPSSNSSEEWTTP